MLIAQKLRKTNMAEYLLYMWQVENILRAWGCDFEKVKKNYLSQFNLPPEQQAQVEEWYEQLCDMMHREGVTEHGHLQINRNVVITLSELHGRLMASPKYPFYHAAFHKVLPYLVEVRSRGADKVGDVETCFDVLYGVMLLRLQKKKVSPETERAVSDVTTLLGLLSDYYFKDRAQPLDF